MRRIARIASGGQTILYGPIEAFIAGGNVAGDS
jgi:hypothetical protein